MINPPVFGATNILHGLDADKPSSPKPGDQYIATDTKLTYICYERAGFAISTAVFSQSIATQDTNPTGLTFNSDGSKMYEVGSGSSKIYESDLSTPFDISTAVFSQSIATQDHSPAGLTFNSDGSKMYEVGANSDLIYESNLSTPFDISTAGFSQSLATQDTIVTGITFNYDGSKMYEVGDASNLIYESDLSTPFDISTAVFSQSIATQDISSTGLTFNSAVSKMYEVGRGSDKIYESDLSTVGKWKLLVEDPEIYFYGEDETLLNMSDKIEVSSTSNQVLYAGYLAKTIINAQLAFKYKAITDNAVLTIQVVLYSDDTKTEILRNYSFTGFSSLNITTTFKEFIDGTKNPYLYILYKASLAAKNIEITDIKINGSRA